MNLTQVQYEKHLAKRKKWIEERNDQSFLRKLDQQKKDKGHFDKRSTRKRDPKIQKQSRYRKTLQDGLLQPCSDPSYKAPNGLHKLLYLVKIL